MMGQHGHHNHARYSRIPPGNFNLVERAFRPTWDYERIEGLTETVQTLSTQGRLRSALDEIFKALDTYPDHPQALELAMIIVGKGSGIEAIEVQEPLTKAYLLDRLLDPIFTVCSRCSTQAWVSSNCLFGDVGSITVTNPAGLQCYNCGYVVCRNCLQETRRSMTVATVSQTCPHCRI